MLLNELTEVWSSFRQEAYCVFSLLLFLSAFSIVTEPMGNCTYSIRTLNKLYYVCLFQKLAHMILRALNLKSTGQTSRREWINAAALRQNFFSICRTVKLQNKLSASKIQWWDRKGYDRPSNSFKQFFICLFKVI